MHLSNLMSVSWRGITSNKMRSTLTMLGVIIGVASVIALVSIGEGARKEIVQNFESMGTNILTLYMNRWDIRLTRDQVEELPARVPDMESIMSVAWSGGEVTYEGKVRYASVQGVTHVFPSMRNQAVVYGRFFTAVEDEVSRPVAVIGWQVMQEMFAGRNPVGKFLYMNRKPYEIIGVLEEKGQNMGEGIDQMILIPLSCAMRDRGTNRVDTVYMKAKDKDSVPIVELTVKRIFEARYGQDAVYIWTQQAALDQMQESTRTMTLMLGAIAGVSLLVGGIGVMNIMLVAVAERTREIGLRMAVGAKRHQVMFQFLMESAMLCSFGGALGVAGGLGVSSIVARTGTKTAVSAMSTAVAFAFAILVGFLFGMYPAYRASKLQPADALRSD